ncbi:hypothetical protein DCW30_09130 [Streptomyces alfalfae]|uniref:Uncharacterized protein n=1 Tax=Streptomyces alfalfae TaxID=1642299 RepID=A0ABM6GWH2_9ACTN|nr:hypothetical protein A7J05_20805 [Streptomyces alfalfae]AYA18194.1 hypothetical protein D3X13_19890 [Streptomyces fradiae]RXX45537.1 hypothetical protein DCW30_09130 [Streptomyces alfalfae]RZM91731.1 hypothetical protein D4104_22710 [Streptomyces alfalfae]
MNAGTSSEPGKSRMTISTYRLTGDGRQIGKAEEHTTTAAPCPAARLADVAALPLPRCHTPR